jgi:hypothetical protein
LFLHYTDFILLIHFYYCHPICANQWSCLYINFGDTVSFRHSVKSASLNICYVYCVKAFSALLFSLLINSIVYILWWHCFFLSPLQILWCCRFFKYKILWGHLIIISFQQKYYLTSEKTAKFTKLGSTNNKTKKEKSTQYTLLIFTTIGKVKKNNWTKS